MIDTTPSPTASERAQSIHSDMPVLTAAFYEMLYRRITSEITAAEQAAEARGAANAINDIAAVLDANDVEAFTALIMKAKASPDLEPVGRSALKSEAEIAAEAELRGAERMRERCVAFVKVKPETVLDYDHEPAQTEEAIRLGIATALAALPLEEGKE